MSSATFTYRELADELQHTAQQEAFSLDALHQYAFRDATGIGASTIADVQRRCAALMQASLHFRAMAAQEQGRGENVIPIQGVAA